MSINSLEKLMPVVWFIFYVWLHVSLKCFAQRYHQWKMNSPCFQRL